MTAAAPPPAVAAALHSLETLLVVRQDVLLTLEECRVGARQGERQGEHRAAPPDADIARLTATAQRLAADIARLLAELEALVPPEGR